MMNYICRMSQIIAFILALTPLYAAEFRLEATPSALEIPAGGEGLVSLVFDIPGGSHIYGNPLGPGTGKPTTVSVQNTHRGIVFKAPRFSEAKIHFSQGDRGYVRIYEKKAYIFLPVTVRKDVVPGKKRVVLTVDSLLCSQNSCVPKIMNLDYVVKVLPEGSRTSSADPLLLEMSRRAKEAGSALDPISGKAGSETEQVDIPYDFQPRYLAGENVTNIIQAILFGIIAGLILNFMPCVLPVVSLKVVGFITMGHDDRKKVLKMGILFSLGILTVFLVLATLAAFLGFGWGELFKKQGFLLVMIGIVFAMGLSMFEVFTLSPPSFSGKAPGEGLHPLLESYGKGLLATLLATPCSGPFLGGTLAWALLQPPVIVFVIFTSVGLGMAVPYLVLSAKPSLLKFIPKPGEWTITLERFMGFLLMGTTVYLLGILEQGLLLPALWFLLLVFMAFWQYGKYGSPVNPPLTRALSAAALLIILVGGYWSIFHSQGGAGSEGTEIHSGDFSLRKLAENNGLGKITVVKFTADWCPNCRLVESTSLYTEKVGRLIRENGIDLVTADITRHNAEAEGVMKKLGTRSIPFLAVFPPGEGFTRPWCLRDMYSEDDVVGALMKALKEVPEISVDDIIFGK